MDEEFVTKAILKFLRDKGYTIIAFDFPQSGTGILLHPNTSMDKNEGIKPDVIASKNETLIIMENKDKYWRSDFEKLHRLKTTCDYTQALNNLHREYRTAILKVGVGIPSTKKTVDKALETRNLVDFIIIVDEQVGCEVVWGGI